MMPYDRNPHFLGRDDLLIHLRAKLEETDPKQYNHRIAIYGMGGVGKTQCAIEYVYRHEEDYGDIYWISASDQTALLSGFQEIGTKTGCLPNGIDGLNPTKAAKNVLDWLRLQKNWLLVIDNLDDISVADGFLPAMDKGGHTLITTRNPNAKNIPAEGLQIPVFGRDDAIELLRVRSEITEADVPSFGAVAADIVNELGYLALAIDHAAAFVRSLNLNITEFLPIYRESRKEILSRPSTSKHTYPNSIVVTFLLSFDKVKLDQKYGTQASKLLQLLVFLNPDEILVDFLRAGADGLDDEVRDIIENKLVFHESLGLLEKFSLIGRSRGKGSVVIHRLVQTVLRDELSEPDLHWYLGQIIGICTTAFPTTWDTQDTREMCRNFQNQVVEPSFEAAKVPSPGAANILSRIGIFLDDDGKSRDGERLKLRCYEIRLELFGCEHMDTLTSMNDLAVTYLARGKLQDASDLLERVLETSRKTIGEEHPNTLTSMNNLAMTYSNQGKLQDAAELGKRVVEARRRTLGDEHPGTLLSMGNLASTYHNQGKLQDAADLKERVLEATRRTLGEEHPDTLTSMNNLAMTYWSQGNQQTAATLEERTLEARKRTLGEEHPDALMSMNNLAWMYEAVGRATEALLLIQQSVDGSQKTLGEAHPSTVDRKITLQRLRNNLTESAT